MTNPSSYLPSHPFVSYLRPRGALRRAIASIVLVSFAIATTVSLILVSRDARQESDRQIESLRDTYAFWYTRASQQLSKAASASEALAGFASGGATVIPPHLNGTLEERIQYINNDTWPIFAAELFERTPGVTMLLMQPSGVVVQDFPIGTPLLDSFRSHPGAWVDVLARPAAREAYLAMIEAAVPQVQGPLLDDDLRPYMVARHPVYLDVPKALNTFWGAGVAFFRIEDLFAALNFTVELEMAGFDWWVYSQSLLNETAPLDTVLTSVPSNPESVRDNGVWQALPTVSPTHDLVVCISSRAGLASSSLSSVHVVMVVAAALGGSLLLGLLLFAGVFVAFVLRHRRAPRSTSRGGDTVVALVSVKRLTWWKEQPGAGSALEADLAGFRRSIESIAASHGCYDSGRISEGCVMVVARSADELREFARFVAAEARFAAGRGAAWELQRLNAGTDSEHIAHATARKKSDDLYSARRSCRSSHDGHSTSAFSDGLQEVTSETSRRSSHNTAIQLRPSEFDVGVAMHTGQLAARYDPHLDRFSYTGPAIATAATAVDATRRGEISATPVFVETHAPQLLDSACEIRQLDDGGALVVLVESKSTHSTERSGGKGKGGREEDRSVATVLAAQTGTVLRKRVAVLLVDLVGEAGASGPTSRNPSLLPMSSSGSSPPSKSFLGTPPMSVSASPNAAALGHPSAPQPPPPPPQSQPSHVRGIATSIAPRFAELLTDIAHLVEENGGELAAVQDTSVLIVFNARVAASAALTRAVHTDVALRQMLPHVRMVSVVTGGYAHIATLAGHLVCAGDAVTKARRLLAAAVLVAGSRSVAVGVGAAQHSARSVPAVLRTCLADASAVDALNQHFDLQCLGPLAPYRTLVYAVEQEWRSETAEGEWLYCLQAQQGQSIFREFNEAFEALHDGRLDEGSSLGATVLARDNLLSFDTGAVEALRAMLSTGRAAMQGSNTTM